jgi:hypothetical protein
MEKNEIPIVGASEVAAGASAAAPVQAPVAACNVAAGASVAGASAAAPVQAPVAASNVAAGALAAGASAAAPVQAPVAASNVAASASAATPIQALVAWDPYEDPYEPVPYIAPKNPYDTSIIDDEPEVTLCSLVLIPFNPFVLDLALLGFVCS